MTGEEFKRGVIQPVQCYKEAWEMIKGQYWMVFATVLVGILVGSIIPFLIIGPMICGIYLCLFDAYDGKPVDLGKLFKGFDYFLPSLLVTLIIVVPVIFMMILFYIPMIMLAASGGRMGDEEVFMFIGGMLLVEFIFIIAMVCLHTLVIFSYQLLVDRKTSAWRSITLSARAVWANLGGIAGLMGVGMIVVFLGYLALCVGVYLAIPLIFAANLVAYRKVFPALPGANFQAPPPPNVYQGFQG
ncbi:MAG: hypothetical protein KF685_09625 [Acidobacteria bacterium]|nr:hypothetical protein [Acidobacteriota bacterium]